MDTSVQCPDIYPIEILDHEIRNYTISSNNELKSALQDICDKIEPKFLRKTCVQYVK